MSTAPSAPTATTPSAASAASAAGLTKVYGTGEATVVALDAVDVTLEAGRLTAVMGPSGSGKSTLMHCLAGLDTPTSGRAWIGPTEITGLGEAELTRVRRDRIGFVFQSFNLLPMLTAEQNVTLPLRLAGRTADAEWLDWLLETLGLAERRTHRPSELSGGQQQRVAIARSLVTRPDVVFADEPTGALDSRSGQQVLELLRRSVEEIGQSIVMVTHDPRAAAVADRVVHLADGRVVGDERQGA